MRSDLEPQNPQNHRVVSNPTKQPPTQKPQKPKNIFLYRQFWRRADPANRHTGERSAREGGYMKSLGILDGKCIHRKGWCLWSHKTRPARSLGDLRSLNGMILQDGSRLRNQFGTAKLITLCNLTLLSCKNSAKSDIFGAKLNFRDPLTQRLFVNVTYPTIGGSSVDSRIFFTWERSILDPFHDFAPKAQRKSSRPNKVAGLKDHQLVKDSRSYYYVLKSKPFGPLGLSGSRPFRKKSWVGPSCCESFGTSLTILLRFQPLDVWKPWKKKQQTWSLPQKFEKAPPGKPRKTLFLRQ